MDPVSTSIATLDNAIKALKFTMARIDDWRKVIPEGIALTNECNKFNDIIEDLLNKPDLPISDELKRANTTIVTSNKLIAEFINNDTRQGRSGWNEIWWKIQRLILAYNHRATFKTTTIKLEKHKEEFTKILDFTRAMDTPTAYWYKKNMINEDCFKFWKDIGGQGLSVSWTEFTNAYHQKHPKQGEEWNGDVMERIRRVAYSGSEDTQLSISGFISLTNKCGFPLDYEKLPKLIDSHAVMSTQTRMDVAKMINDLISYYSTQEMRDSLVSVFQWYGKCNKDERKVKAQKWAQMMIAMRSKPKEQWNSEEQLAEKVDMARRTHSFFFQRYMVVFKIGQLSKDMFAEVDFPGKARMHEFINNMEPLDEANFKVVMKKSDKEWPSKKPKVYKFLNDYIDSEDRKKEEAKRKKEEQERKKEEQDDLNKQQKNEKQQLFMEEKGIGVTNGQVLDPMNAGNQMVIDLSVAESAIPLIDGFVGKEA